MKKGIKYVIVDIDGTLVTDSRKLLNETIETIKKAKKRNIKHTKLALDDHSTE